MLSSPSHAVVGCTDLEETERFLGHFGLEGEPGAGLSAGAATALYGLDGPAAQRVLRTPGADRGWVRLVATPHAARHPGPYDARPIAIDFYTRDIERSIDVSRQAGAEVRDLVEYALGPIEVKEVEVVGPDHLVVVFIEVNMLRPSVLDHDPDRLHSEVHAIVHSVQDTGAALPFWTEAADLQTLIDAPIEGPMISQLMGLPRENVPVRFTLMCDGDSRPARFELLQFVDDPGEQQPTLPLAAGLHAPGFTVADLDQAMAGLAPQKLEPSARLSGPTHPCSESVAMRNRLRAGAEFGSVVKVGTAKAVSAMAPGRVRFELWQAVDG